MRQPLQAKVPRTNQSRLCRLSEDLGILLEDCSSLAAKHRLLHQSLLTQCTAPAEQCKSRHYQQHHFAIDIFGMLLEIQGVHLGRVRRRAASEARLICRFARPL